MSPVHPSVAIADSAPLPPPARSDAALLAGMTRLIFEIGFRAEAIRARWPDFERAFLGFEPEAVAAFSAGDLERLAADPSLIRNRAKLSAVIHNARAIVRVAATHGSFHAFLERLADEPYERRAGCLVELFARVGPRTAFAFLLERGLADESDAP